MKKIRLKIAAAGAVAVASVVGMSGVASATQVNSCNNQTDCFWYGAWSGSSGTGAVAAFNDGAIPDLLPYYFRSAGSGSGTHVGNNSHSVKDNYSNQVMFVYYSASYQGHTEEFSVKVGGNLDSILVNNDRSVRNED